MTLTRVGFGLQTIMQITVARASRPLVIFWYSKKVLTQLRSHKNVITLYYSLVAQKITLKSKADFMVREIY